MAETNGDTKTFRPSGIYKHPQNGKEIEVKWDPVLGDAQASAVERLGFVFDREGKGEEVQEANEVINQTQESQSAMEEEKAGVNKVKKGKK